MFNILGFQEEKQHINTKDEFNDKKEEMFYNNGKVNLDVGLLDNLTERDKYVIEKSEEEFSQNRKFIRLLPHRDSKKYIVLHTVKVICMQIFLGTSFIFLIENPRNYYLSFDPQLCLCNSSCIPSSIPTRGPKHYPQNVCLTVFMQLC